MSYSMCSPAAAPRFLMVLGVLFLSVVAPAQGQTVIRDANIRERQVPFFNSISVSSAIDLRVSQGGSQAVAVSASDRSYLEDIVTEVKNQTLYIRYKPSWTWGNRQIRAYVSAPALNKISASGACNVLIDGILKGGDVELKLSGSSNFKGRVSAGNLQLDASGSSDFQLEGMAETLKVSVSGASDVKAIGLNAQYAEVTASGASDVSLTVLKELSVSASGASDVQYRGNAVVRQMQTSGASSVKKRND